MSSCISDGDFITDVKKSSFVSAQSFKSIDEQNPEQLYDSYKLIEKLIEVLRKHKQLITSFLN